MANPNVVGVQTVRGKSSLRRRIRTTPSNFLVNNSSSGEILKVNSIYICNHDNTSNVTNVTIQMTGGSTQTIPQNIIDSLSIAPSTSMVVVSKNFDLYINEGTSLSVFATKSNVISLICSYEQISDGTPPDRNDEEQLEQQLYTTSGTYTWVVPANVNTFAAICVGGGGSGGPGDNRNGGGGAELSWVNYMTSTPGESLTVTVGVGASSAAARGGNTSITRGATTLVSAIGGVSATSGGPGVGGAGGVKHGGGIGGNGGTTDGSNSAGGGGAGGYTGDGGKGSDSATLNSTAGSGGAGGGAGFARVSEGDGAGGYGGGGVGILVPGDSGAAGGARQGGFGGSSGTNGSRPNAGVYGGGGGGNGNGGSGAVRIIWGSEGDSVFPIVTSGLLLNLDAGESLSYPGTGTTWTDLSGNNNNGTLVNSPTFDSANKGSLVWNSSRVCTVPMTNLRPTSQITQECWFKLSSNAAQVFIGAQYGSGSNNSYALWMDAANTLNGGVNIGGSFNFQAQSFTLTTGIWYHFVHTYDGSNQTTYINGVSIRTWATTGSIVYDTSNTLLAIGNDWNSGYNGGASIGVLGNLAVTRIYNRSLSLTEIRQNYNSLRGRYGI